ncbi:MAG: sigma-70 family RNA polymerase sigma factor [Alphaproteobacteria bacterium]
MNRHHAIAEQIPRLRRYARALVGNAVDADDLVQDCLERALARLDQWRDGDSPRRWMFTILHNIHVDRLRAQARRPALVPVDDQAATHPPEQHDRLEFRDVSRALMQLPVENRQALLLVGVEGMKYREAAAVLDIPVGTLMSRLARGRERLRACLDTPPAPVRLRSIR